MMRLLDALEVTDRDKRLKVARAILYLAQGGCGQPSQCPFDHSQRNIFVSLRALIDQKGKRKKNVSPGVFDECDTEADVLRWSRSNVFLLHDMGIFTALLELLSMEIE